MDSKADGGEMNTQSIKDELNLMANNLYYVAGYITSVSKCDNTAVKDGCKCDACDRLNKVHDCMNRMERMIKEIQ